MRALLMAALRLSSHGCLADTGCRVEAAPDGRPAALLEPRPAYSGVAAALDTDSTVPATRLYAVTLTASKDTFGRRSGPEWKAARHFAPALASNPQWLPCQPARKRIQAALARFPGFERNTMT